MADEDDDDSKPLIDLSAYTRKRPSNFDSGRPEPGADPTPENPHARQKARAIPRMGEVPKLPKHVPERPEMIDNPQGNVLDPVTISVERPPIKRDYAPTTVRRVVPAEIDWVLEWGIPRFQHRYPRCTPQAWYGELQLACNGGSFYFVRTDSACGLFVAIRTPEEPEITVLDRFVVKRREAADAEALSIYRSALEWAKSIGAVAYTFSSSTGVKLDKIADALGADVRTYGYTKILG
ncbi:MAG TPA: hypothetical protein VLL82_07310 [Mycobacterium sp.]|nr:hypothetical protein [Mycobacterium sp.]